MVLTQPSTTSKLKGNSRVSDWPRQAPRESIEDDKIFISQGMPMVWRGLCVHNSGALWLNVQCLCFPVLANISFPHRESSGPGS